ncbi:hypothetical protein EJ03DRAFT_220229 [Teratosphaeria nubilosa]|uniref:F-box domain-containing protein n=1 Tax=Teratosphaeria nubilosa TaxID=161662 RepID=A0A6G1KXN5_9PEZI|nr:hypothetical protein EJ03DRAFT_220229 [Teratosphaeria nubilosa]
MTHIKLDLTRLPISYALRPNENHRLHISNPIHKMASLAQQNTDSDLNSMDQVFRFGDLPAELRLAIYKELLLTKVVHIGRSHLANGALKQGSQYLLTVEEDVLVAVLRISRLAYKEALPLFYGISNFSCSDPGTLKKFVTEIGPGIQHIEYLKIDNWMGGSGAEVAFRVLAEKAPRLKKVVLELEACSCTRSKLLGSMLKESLRNYLEDVSPAMRRQRLSTISLHLVPVGLASVAHHVCATPSPSVLQQKAEEVMAVLQEA